MKNDEIEEENELILDLSIGGIFSKPARDSHALRQKQKREEKLKKSVGFGSCGSVNGPFVENKVWLESEIVGRNGDVLENEPVRKKEKICNGNGNGNGKLTENVRGLVFRPVVCRDDVYSDGQCSSHQGKSQLFNCVIYFCLYVFLITYILLFWDYVLKIDYTFIY